MKASQPANTLFLWNMEDISLKPIQEITLATSIAQW